MTADHPMKVALDSTTDTPHPASPPATHELLRCLIDFVQDYEQMAYLGHHRLGDDPATWRARWRADEGPEGFDLVWRARELLRRAGVTVEDPEQFRWRDPRGRKPKKKQ